jgi:hypothetical protein
MTKNYIGLYYPFIHFKDDDWLKLTALYWDGISRIVPSGYQPKHDSETVKKLAGELNFIENIDPGYAAEEVGFRFISVLKKHGDELVKHYDLAKSNSWPDDPITSLTAPPGSNPKLAYIFNEKLSRKFQDDLFKENLATTMRGDDPRWIGMHPKLVSVYMEALADEMARRCGYHPLTDETLDHIAVTGCTVERLAQALLGDVKLLPPEAVAEQEIEERLVRMAIQTVIPEDMSVVPVEKIIKLRQQHLGELVSFQSCVNGLVHDIQKLEIKDPESLKKHLQIAYDKNIKLKQDELRKALESNDIKTTVSALLVSTAPSSIAATAFAALGIAAPLVGIGVIALGLTKVFLDQQKANTEAMQKSPAAYLLRMEKKLKPRNLLRWVVADTHEFFFG